MKTKPFFLGSETSVNNIIYKWREPGYAGLPKLLQEHTDDSPKRSKTNPDKFLYLSPLNVSAQQTTVKLNKDSPSN